VFLFVQKGKKVILLIGFQKRHRKRLKMKLKKQSPTGFMEKEQLKDVKILTESLNHIELAYYKESTRIP